MDRNMALGDLTQESVMAVYDSDGAIAMTDGTDEEVANMNQLVNDLPAPVDQRTSVPEGEHPNEARLTDAQLLSKFKSVLNCHKSQQSKKRLWKVLLDQEFCQKKLLIQENPRLLGEGPQECVSLHLAIDQARESIQHSYRHSRTKSRKRRR
jgi:hypothetical protein